MRVRAALLVILCVILSAPLVAQTFVQSNTTNDPNGNGSDNLTYTCTYPQDNGAGNTLIFAVRGGLPAQSVTDSQGNHWIPVMNGPIELWYAINSKAGPNTVTLTYSAGQTFQAVCTEYAGLYLLDAFSSIATGESSTSVSPNVTTSATNDLIIGFGTNDTANGAGGVRGDLTAGTGFTLRGNANIFVEDLVQSPAGTANSTLTYGAVVDWNQGIAAFTPKAAGSPVITGISPTFGPAGLLVTITGTNFGDPPQGTNTVTFNGLAGTATSWSSTQIIVPVPTGASSGPVVVNVGGISSNQVSFEVTPALQYGTVNDPNGNGTDNLTYACAYPHGNAAGNTLVLAARFGVPDTWTVSDSQGNNWIPVVNGPTGLWYAINSKAGPNTITITYSQSSPLQAVCAEYSGLFLLDQTSQIASGESAAALSPTITTTTPNDLIIGFGTNSPGYGAIAGQGFTLRGWVNAFIEDMRQTSVGAISSGATYPNVVDWQQGVAAFSPITAGSPVITGVNPAFGPAGLPVTITGTNFGTSQGSITFNGTVATPTSWSATQIVVPVPSGASSGPIVVTAGGIASNQVAFEVTQALQYGTVNEPNGNGGDNLIYTCGYPQGNRAGDTLVIAVRGGYPAQSVTDSQGNTWIPVVNGPTELWYATNSKAGANTVTVTYSTAQPLQAVCAEYSGSWVLDQTSQVSPGNGTQATSPSITTSASGDLILGFGTYNAYSTITPQSGFGLRSGVNIFIEDGLQQAAGAIASSVTYAAATDWTQGIAAFKAGSLPTSPSPFITHVNKSSNGNSVTIIGGNFGSTRGQSTVAFNDGQLVASVTSWSDTQIVVPIPTGAVTGSIFVTIGGDAVVPVQNPSFENAATLDLWCFLGCVNQGPIPSWTIAGSGSGSWQANNNYYTPPFADGGTIITYDSGGTISQTLTGISLQPNTTYKLTVGIGQRLDNLIANYSISLMAGSTVLATQSGSNATIPAGSFVDQTLAYSTNGIVTSGDLSIVLSSDGSQIGFDNVRLTVGTQPFQSTATWYFPVTSSAPSAPNIASISPNAGSIGTSVTITGTNFGSAQGSVTFSGVSATPTSWTDNQIIVPVPAGANSGAVQVSVGGVNSNSVTFTLEVPPTISASVFPPPSQNGWNNSNVTVTFACTAGSSAIVTCPAPQNVTSDGGNEVISGTAIDANGLTSVVSVELNIDRTPPLLAIAAPTDGSTLSTATTTVSGTVADNSSGIAAATCNGVSAAVTSGTFSCSITLNAGNNLIAVTAIDVAGNRSSAYSHVVLTTTPTTPASLHITPQNPTMLVGNTQNFSVSDEQGHERQDAAWTLSDTSLGILSADSEPTLTATAAGQVTITASVDGVSVQTQVTIMSGTSLSPGTIRWTLTPAAGLATQQIVYGKIGNGNTPNLYAVESDGTTNNLIVALTSDGQQKWTAQIGGNSLLGITGIPDASGGLIVHLHPLRGMERFIDLDGQTGTQLWEHDSSPDTHNFLRGVAIGSDGTVFFREVSFAPDPVVVNQMDALWSLVGLDGETGALVFNYPVPQSTQVVGDQVLATNNSQLSDPIVGSDGTVFATAVVVSQPVTNIAYNQTVMLIKGTTAPYCCTQEAAPGGISRIIVGSPSVSTIAEVDFSSQPLSGISAPFVGLIGLMPDGHDNVLATWWTNQILPQGQFNKVNHISHVTSDGVSDFTYPFGSPFSSQLLENGMVLGENDVAFATDGVTAVSFGVADGSVNWSFQSPNQSTISFVESEASNGVVGKLTDQNGTDTVVRFDPSGTPTVDGWSSTGLDYYAADLWTGTSSPGGPVNVYSAGPVQTASTGWTSPNQKKDLKAAQPIHVTSASQSDPNQTTIRTVFQKIKTALDADSHSDTPVCSNWLQANGVTGSFQISVILGLQAGENEHFGHATVNALKGQINHAFRYGKNPDGSNPEIPSSWAIAVNDAGGFFNAKDKNGAFYLGHRGYQGGTLRAQATILMHELAHVIGAPDFQDDHVKDDTSAVEQNDKLLDSKCRKLIEGLQ